MNRHADRGWILVVVAVVLIGAAMGGMFVAFKPKDHRVTVNPATCTCDDYDDMKRRRALAEAAEASINNDVLPNVPSGDMFDGAVKNATLPTIDAAMKKVPWKTGRSGKGETKPSCLSNIDAPTPCLKAALQAHENVHVKACDDHIAKGGKGDWKDSLTMADYWREDASAYKAEKDYLDRELNLIFNDMNCMHYSTYPGAQTRGDQQQRLAGAKRRVAKYAGSLS